jgi:hypothetical protein
MLDDAPPTAEPVVTQRVRTLTISPSPPPNSRFPRHGQGSGRCNLDDSVGPEVAVEFIASSVA